MLVKSYPAHVVHVAVSDDSHLQKSVQDKKQDMSTYIQSSDIQVVLKLSKVSAVQTVSVRRQAVSVDTQITHSDSRTPELKISFAYIVP